MYKLNSLGNEPKQQITLLTEENTRVVLSFEYKANQLGWFFGFEYNGEKYENIRLTTSYNILRAYRNWLPFGIMCATNDNFEPLDLNDFATGYASVFILTKEDINGIESNYYTKVYEYPPKPEEE